MTETEKRPLTPHEQDVLAAHALWLKSGGEEGEQADFRGADLSGADFKGADLWGADLRGADLTGTDLRGAYLRGADLRGAEVTQEQLATTYGKPAFMPDGTTPDAVKRAQAS